jgi:hypothetical protein
MQRCYAHEILKRHLGARRTKRPASLHPRMARLEREDMGLCQKNACPWSRALLTPAQRIEIDQSKASSRHGPPGALRSSPPGHSPPGAPLHPSASRPSRGAMGRAVHSWRKAPTIEEMPVAAPLLPSTTMSVFLEDVSSIERVLRARSADPFRPWHSRGGYVLSGPLGPPTSGGSHKAWSRCAPRRTWGRRRCTRRLRPRLEGQGSPKSAERHPSPLELPIDEGPLARERPGTRCS